jgi:hypothetical protein
MAFPRATRGAGTYTSPPLDQKDIVAQAIAAGLPPEEVRRRETWHWLAVFAMSGSGATLDAVVEEADDEAGPWTTVKTYATVVPEPPGPVFSPAVLVPFQMHCKTTADPAGQASAVQNFAFLPSKRYTRIVATTAGSGAAADFGAALWKSRATYLVPEGMPTPTGKPGPPLVYAHE